MFVKLSGSVTIRVEAMVFGNVIVFKTFSLDGVMLKCLLPVASRYCCITKFYMNIIPMV